MHSAIAADSAHRPVWPTLILGCGQTMCDGLALPDMDAVLWTEDLCYYRSYWGER